MKKILSFALAAVLTVALSAPALAWESRFGDVPTNHWAAEAINRADRKSTRLNSSHSERSRIPSSA